ncbi:MAG: stage II sporulation protein M, partial [Planctomycetota bacterium]
MAFQLKSYEFRREREKSWRELDRLVARIEKNGIASLEPEDLARLPLLYRAALSSLSVARSISLDRNVLNYLEGLSFRAFFCVYATRRRFFASIRLFVIYTFPRTVRAFAGPILISALFIILGAAAGFVLTLDDFDRYYSLVPENYAQGRNPSAGTEDLRGELYTHVADYDYLTNFALFLFTHNAKVGILSFSLGIVLGIPVFVLLFIYTGMLIGAMSALFHSRGLSLDWWGWILPHGVTELLAVVLCGAGGLALAQSIIWPGPRRRLDNLMIRGRQAGILLLGAIVMFFIASVIEGVM